MARRFPRPICTRQHRRSDRMGTTVVLWWDGVAGTVIPAIRAWRVDPCKPCDRNARRHMKSTAMNQSLSRPCRTAEVHPTTTSEHWRRCNRTLLPRLLERYFRRVSRLIRSSPERAVAACIAAALPVCPMRIRFARRDPNCPRRTAIPHQLEPVQTLDGPYALLVRARVCCED